MNTMLTRDLGRRNLLIIQHGANLADDLSGGQIAFQTQQRGETKLAIHGAARLAGNTNRAAIPGAAGVLCLTASFTAIAGFAVITFGHPNGFHGLTVAEFHQVTHGAVARGKLLGDHRQTDGKPLVA